MLSSLPSCAYFGRPDLQIINNFNVDMGMYHFFLGINCSAALLDALKNSIYLLMFDLQNSRKLLSELKAIPLVISLYSVVRVK